MAIGLAYMGALLMACSTADLAIAPPQWKLIPVAGIGGLLGSLIDSLIGELLSFLALKPPQCETHPRGRHWWPPGQPYSRYRHLDR